MTDILQAPGCLRLREASTLPLASTRFGTSPHAQARALDKALQLAHRWLRSQFAVVLRHNQVGQLVPWLTRSARGQLFLLRTTAPARLVGLITINELSSARAPEPGRPLACLFVDVAGPQAASRFAVRGMRGGWVHVHARMAEDLDIRSHNTTLRALIGYAREFVDPLAQLGLQVDGHAHPLWHASAGDLRDLAARGSTLPVIIGAMSEPDYLTEVLLRSVTLVPWTGLPPLTPRENEAAPRSGWAQFILPDVVEGTCSTATTAIDLAGPGWSRSSDMNLLYSAAYGGAMTLWHASVEESQLPMTWVLEQAHLLRHLHECSPDHGCSCPRTPVSSNAPQGIYFAYPSDHETDLDQVIAEVSRVVEEHLASTPSDTSSDTSSGTRDQERPELIRQRATARVRLTHSTQACARLRTRLEQVEFQLTESRRRHSDHVHVRQEELENLRKENHHLAHLVTKAGLDPHQVTAGPSAQDLELDLHLSLQDCLRVTRICCPHLDLSGTRIEKDLSEHHETNQVLVADLQLLDEIAQEHPVDAEAWTAALAETFGDAYLERISAKNKIHRYIARPRLWTQLTLSPENTVAVRRVGGPLRTT